MVSLIPESLLVSSQMWPILGQEQFKSLRTPFYRGSDVCLLVFSLTNRESFENLEYWKKEFFYHADVQNNEFPFVLLGNKCDSTETRVVSREEVDQFVSTCPNMEYYETSAKLNENVEKAFIAAIEKFKKFEEDALNRDPFKADDQKVDLNKIRKKNRPCSC